MKTLSYYSVLGALAFTCLFSSCAFLQKGEFAERKYYNFPRTKHAGDQITSTLKQNKAASQDVASSDQKEKHTASPLLSASAGKKEIIFLKKEIKNSQKPIQVVAPVTNYNKAEIPSISFKKSDIKKQALKSSNHFYKTDADLMLVLMVIAAIFIPPLAVYLKDHKANKWFWITLLLCIFGGGFGLGGIGAGFGLLWLIAIVIALLDVFDLL